MRFEKEIEAIKNLATLSEKLKYYNDNVTPLFNIGIEQHKVGFDLGKEMYNIFCVCQQHKGLYTLSDFEIYRDIRNNETQKVFDFFEHTEDYNAKIEYYFKICEGYSTTKRILYFIPDKLEEIDNRLFPYKEKIIDITPKNNNEIEILKNNIKEKLLLDVKNFYLPLAQFTFEKRVEVLNNYLIVRTEKKRREELLQLEYDKINLSKVDINSKKPYDRMLFNILNTVENIIQGKHVEYYTEFSKIKITILAEDAIKYEKYLNSLCNNSNYNENSNDNKIPSNLTKVNPFEDIELINNIQKKKYPVVNDQFEIDDKLSKAQIEETRTILKQKPSAKVPAKYHALAYIIELLVKGDKPPKDSDGNFKKDEIIKIGIERCNDSGQNFYNFVKDHFENVSSNNIKYSVFKNNWKEIVLELTTNKEKLEKYLQNNNL